MHIHDLVIRNGNIVDGSGKKPFLGDIAIDDGKITKVGEVINSGKKEIDADGNLVSPGWVDIHTHYDGQVCWDPYLTPSSWHGVTTVVMGNCGVGFAPVKPGDENFLIQLMEGVEDIPGTALHEGIDWEWETFPEFLDAIENKDTNLLTNSQGIGKRIAERLIVELKNKLHRFIDNNKTSLNDKKVIEPNQFSKYIDEIYLILNSLGYVDNEIKDSIKIIITNENENSLLLNSLSAEEKEELMDKHLKEILMKLSEKST